MVKRLTPRLWMNHPNFFMTYFVTATILHLGLSLTQILDKERYYNSAFSKVYELMSIEAWALCSFLVFLFMTIGAYRKFYFWGRIGLCLGLFICLCRGLLIELGPGSGGGLFVWIPLAVFHFAQLSEPPINPLTKRG